MKVRGWKKNRGFSKFNENKFFVGGWFFNYWSFTLLPKGHVRSHTNFGPCRFSRFDVYRLQTNKQTDWQAKVEGFEKSMIFYWRPWIRCTRLSLKKLKLAVSDSQRYLLNLWSIMWRIFSFFSLVLNSFLTLDSLFL